MFKDLQNTWNYHSTAGLRKLRLKSQGPLCPLVFSCCKATLAELIVAKQCTCSTKPELPACSLPSVQESAIPALIIYTHRSNGSIAQKASQLRAQSVSTASLMLSLPWVTDTRELRILVCYFQAKSISYEKIEWADICTMHNYIYTYIFDENDWINPNDTI